MIFQTILLFTLLIIIPASSIIFKKQYMDKAEIYNRKTHYMFTIVLTLFITSLVLLSLKLDKISLPKIGLTNIKYNSFENTLTTILIVLSIFIIIINYISVANLKSVIAKGLIDNTKLNELKKTLPIQQADKIYFILISLTAGICEEVIYRGFLTHYISNTIHLKGIITMIIVSLIFALAHVCQGIVGATNSFILSLLWTSLYFSTGSLLIPIVFHILYDLKMCLYPLINEIESIELNINTEDTNIINNNEEVA